MWGRYEEWSNTFGCGSPRFTLPFWETISRSLSWLLTHEVTEVGLDFLIPIAEITVTCSPDPLSLGDTREQTRGFTHARQSVLLLSHLVSSRSNIPSATLSALPYMECMIITGTFLLGGLHCGQPYRISFCEHCKNLQVCLEFTVVT